MTLHENTTVRLSDYCLPCPCEGEVVLALIDRYDFERARSTIAGFADWETFEDYVYDREGWLMGLSSAGQDTRLTSVSISAFLFWTAHAGVAPTLSHLDDFAGLVEDFRRNPGAPVEAVPTDEWRRADFDGSPRDRRFRVPIASDHYRDWLACLGSRPAEAPLDAYARLVVEIWAESP